MLESTTSKIIAGLVIHKIFCKPDKELEKRIKEREEREQAELDREFEKVNRITKKCEELQAKMKTTASLSPAASLTQSRIDEMKRTGELKSTPLAADNKNNEEEGTWQDALLGLCVLIGIILFFVWLL
ncbi:Uncharacterised protein [Phocoenobacter uteri]|uniref:Uncharacterized protein n=1 Tax=Phocoenobacter uteri TaxID=146806 RepID=A0A379CB93_9PAST|nr:hypothetical protein [Phocoenobacter uteri]MDG6881521.1 hypothetical protein [Phocoenobacter uteri]SUB59551.1 Uncharacterised protein [Phocoenobacter uteri]